MLRYVYADDLHRFPRLADQMFRHRAAQFHDRLGWEVSVDGAGHERDEYDDKNPLYVIWQTADGGHGGSMRFLPTTGDTMVNDHFRHLAGAEIRSPLIWECTRFCLAPGAGPRISAALMLAGGEIMTGFGVKHFVGVFDARMVRIYRLIGAAPEMLGTSGTGREAVSVGLWHFSERLQTKVARTANISPDLARAWFGRAFGPPLRRRESAA